MFFKGVFISFVGGGGAACSCWTCLTEAWHVLKCHNLYVSFEPLDAVSVPTTPYWPSPASVSMGLFVL